MKGEPLKTSFRLRVGVGRRWSVAHMENDTSSTKSNLERRRMRLNLLPRKRGSAAKHSAIGKTTPRRVRRKARSAAGGTGEVTRFDLAGDRVAAGYTRELCMHAQRRMCNVQYVLCILRHSIAHIISSVARISFSSLGTKASVLDDSCAATGTVVPTDCSNLLFVQ